MIPIKIQANDPKTFKIIWQITSDCTYHCEYCPKELHEGTSKEIDLKDFEKFLGLFKDRKIVMTITGGEPTIHPQFLEIINLLKEKNIKTVVDSNLSRSLRFYQEAGPLVDNWCVTLHPSQHQLDLEKIHGLSSASFVVVYVMMDPKYWELATSWYNQLKEIKNIKLTVLKPVNNWAGADYQGMFTKEQQEFLNQATASLNFTQERIAEMKENYSWLMDLGSTITWNNNTVEPVDADSLMRQGLNKFKGWSCSTGNEVVVLDAVGNVSLATCGVTNLGHWSTLNIDDIVEPVICPREFCNCGTDIKGSKIQL